MPEANAIVFVVDNDESTRNGLSCLLRAGNLPTETFSTAYDFLARPRTSAPCCLVLDTSLPGLSGLELQEKLAGERDEIPIIFTSSSRDIATSVRAMKAGAWEFLTKPIEAGVLITAVVGALERSREILARNAELRVLRARYHTLTSREREVLALVVAGRLNKQVGGELGISEITVKAHRGRVMRKMQATSLAELVCIAANLHLTIPRKIEATFIRSRAEHSLYSAYV